MNSKKTCNENLVFPVILDLIVAVLEKKGELLISAKGVSMLPGFYPMDYLHCVKTDPGILMPGDILLYQRNETLIVHRLWQIHGNILCLKGDNCDRFEYIEINQLIAKVIN